MARFQFRLGALLIAVAIVALSLALVFQARREAALRAELARKDVELKQALYDAELNRVRALRLESREDVLQAQEQIAKALENPKETDKGSPSP